MEIEKGNNLDKRWVNFEMKNSFLYFSVKLLFDYYCFQENLLFFIIYLLLV